MNCFGWVSWYFVYDWVPVHAMTRYQLHSERMAQVNALLTLSGQHLNVFKRSSFGVILVLAALFTLIYNDHKIWYRSIKELTLFVSDCTLNLSAYVTNTSIVYVMMTSSNGNIFAWLAFCAGNSPVTGEFHSQRPVTRSFDVFFDLRLNKRLSKQS